jgi:hypothetical protein
MESFELNLYWREPSKRRLIEYLEDLAAFLRSLAPLDPLLSTWFLKGKSKEDALRFNFLDDFQRCAEKLGRRKNNIEADSGPRFGFVFGLWNGHAKCTDGGVALRMDRGWGKEDMLVIDLPFHDAASGELVTVKTLAAVLRVAVARYPIHYAYVPSSRYVPDKYAFRDFLGVGWMAYVPALLDPRDFPEAAQIIHFGTQGSVVVTTNEPFSSENEDHVRRTHAIETRLFDRGLLLPRSR